MKTKIQSLLIAILLFACTRSELYEKAKNYENFKAGYRKQITIQNDFVDADLYEFPLYVEIKNDPDIGVRANNDGSDIYFTGSEGSLLNHEIEFFDITAEAANAIIWVRVPQIYSSSNTYIYIHYGGSFNSKNVPRDVWDSAFVGVWHLNENGNAISEEFKDSTVKNNHGTGGGGTLANTPTSINSKIYRGQDFDGADDYIDCGNALSVNMTTSMTLGAWIYPYIIASGRIISKWDSSSGYELDISTNNLRFSLNQTIQAQSGLVASTWQHVGATWDGTNFKLFINGIEVDNGTYVGPINISTYNLLIGRMANLATSVMDGIIDEVRISNISRPPEWIRFEYHNVNQPDNELIWGSEEQP